MKKKVIIIVMMFFICSIYGQVQGVTKQEEMQEQLEFYTRNMDKNHITKEEVLEIYDEMSKQFTPDDIADIIEENAEEIEKQGISKEIIKAGTNFIRATDTEVIRDMIEKDINFEEIGEKIEQGYTSEQVINSILQDTSTQKKAQMATKLVLSNKIIKNIVIIVAILFIYGTILRWIIYKKAGKSGFAAIIPVYRQIVMYQICDLSPWLMLLWFIPILGWFAMLVVAIMKRFCLAKEFGRGALFGFGLLFLAPIFESILAFHPNIKKEV